MSMTQDEPRKESNLDDLFPELSRGERKSQPGAPTNGNAAPTGLGALVDSRRGAAAPPPPPSQASIADLQRKSAAPPPPPSLRSAAPPPPPSLRSAAPPPPPSLRSAPSPTATDSSAPRSAPPPPSLRSAAPLPPPSLRSAAPPPPPSMRSAAPPPAPAPRSAPPPPSRSVAPAPVAEAATTSSPPSAQQGAAVKPPAPVTVDEPSESVMVADGVEATALDKSTDASTEKPITERSLRAATPIEPMDDADDDGFDDTPTQFMAQQSSPPALSSRLPAGLATSRSASVPPPPPAPATLPSLPRPAPLPGGQRVSAPPPVSASIPPAIVSSQPPPSMSLVPPPPRSRWAMPLLAAAAAALLVTSALLVARPKALGFGEAGGSVVVSVSGPNGGVVPSLKVLVDGAAKCETAPCRVDKLSSGAHFVQVTAPGYQTTASRAVMVDGDKEAVLQVQLEKESTRVASADDADHAAAAAAAPDQQKKPEHDVPTMEVSDIAKKSEPSHATSGSIGSTKAKPAAPSGVAHLNINSIPISAVVLDGRPIGSTPQVGVKVSAGSHTIMFIGPDGKRQVRGAKVAAGGTSSVAVRF